MSKLLAIARRDAASAFTSPIAWVMMSAYAFVTGLMFVMAMSAYQSQTQSILMQAMGNPAADDLLAQLNVIEMVVSPLFQNASVVFLFVIPLLTMRLLAEEKRGGTDELLFTAPLTVNQIVGGKFLAGLGLVLAVAATTAIPIGSLFYLGNPPWKIVLSCYLGLLLLGGTFLAVGLLASSLTENQIIAAVLGFAALLTFFVIGWAGELLGDASTTGKILKYLSITNHYDDFTRGIIDSVHIIYYVSLSFLALFLTARVLESRRWR